MVMNTPRIEINLYLTATQHGQLSLVRKAGLGLSAVARLAIRKCGDAVIDPDVDEPTPKRVLLYIDPEDATKLELLAAREGTSRSNVLRRLISTYLRVNAAAIESLF